MDEKIIKKAMKGNFNAYAILVNQLKNDGYKIAYTILNNEQDSIDAYLQAVEKGLKGINLLKEAKYFKTWFIRIVINEAKNIVIKNNKIILMDEITKDTEVQNYNIKEETIDLEGALQKVDPDIRQMIEMKYYLGYKLDEISEIMNLPIGTVKGKMYTALKSLRKELSIDEYR